MSGKLTLLEMTQNILSSMDSDEVNSIGDTVESLQVAEEIRNTYFELSSALKIPSNQKLRTLEPLSDPTRPNYLKIPEGVQSVEWIQYENSAGVYQDVRYVSPEDFIRRTQWFTTNEPVIEVSDPEFINIKFRIRNNADPTVWTTFNNELIVFNSYNVALDSSLQESKSLCGAYETPNFVLSDDFIPELDIFRFPLLLATAKAACFVNFKQISNANEERRSRRQMVRAQNDLWRAGQRRPYNRTPDYGRRSR
jgi:hypothetical protein